MWILPNHKSDLDLDTVCELFEKSILYRSKPSNAKTWKRRLKSKSLSACRVLKSTFNVDLLKSKCLQVSKKHQVAINEFNDEEFKEWINFNKIDYKVRSNFQKQVWATPTTQETEHHDLVLNSKGRRISKNGKQDHSLNLADQASLNWATPCVGYESEIWERFRKRKCNIGKGPGKGTLSVQVDYTIHNWPTPRADKDAHSEDANRWIARFIKFKGGISSSLALTVDLENFGITKEKLETELKNWSTPAARDYKGTQGRTNKEESLGDLPGQTEGPWSTWKSDLPQDIKTAKELSKKLNPRWVENLMGLPLGWVSAKAYISESEKN